MPENSLMVDKPLTSGVARRGVIGEPFKVHHLSVQDVLGGLGRPYTAVVNDPPWTALSTTVPSAARVVPAWNMDLAHLETLIDSNDNGEVVVGIGGGTALDTAKFLAWKTQRPLIQIPTITSVDAGFTNAVGVRIEGSVRYIANIVPEFVVIDVDVICAAPRQLNRSGIGDILSCHTGLWDWQQATDRGIGHPWRDDLANLGQTLLRELDDGAAEVREVTTDGVRWMADAYRRIGAACAEAGHSRFEEGSEHFWAYAYERHTGAHQIHGELICFAVVALSTVQGNNADWAFDVVTRAGARAHPADLGITFDQFSAALLGLRSYARSEELDFGIADIRQLDAGDAQMAWALATALPRSGAS